MSGPAARASHKPKAALTNVDVAALAAELSQRLVGGRFDKAFQPAKDQVLLRFRVKGLGRQDLLVQMGSYATVTRRPPENPDKPSMVARILRNTFENARLVAVRQVGFDRVLRLELERGDGRRAIILELFGDGNLLILEPDDTILLPMRGADHGVRRLRKGEPYLPPPGSNRPFEMSEEQLRLAGAAAKRDVVRLLALDLGFGPLWAEELCLRADVAKNTKPSDLVSGQWAALHAAIQEVGAAVAANDLEPAVVFAGEEPVDAVPFVLERLPRPEFAYEEASSFIEALDTYFLGAGGDEDDDGEASDDPRRKRFEEAKGKLERQVAQMEGAIGGFEEDEERRRTDGDTLYASYQQAEALLAQLNGARERMSWQQVEATLAQARQAGDEAARKAAEPVVELRPHTGEAVLALADMAGERREVLVDLRLTVQQNADAHYAAAKKAKGRRAGALTALEEARKRVTDLETAGLDAFGAAPEKKRDASRHFWFEHYRWTITPGGLVAVGGRSAAQNDAVVKKYLRDGDRYVHAEIHGAPSVVVRSPGGSPLEPDEADLRAACQFAACSSRAWRQFSEASAYWVTPQQVSKTPRSGEFVPRGAWIVQGKRNVEAHLPMQWAVAAVTFNMGGEPLAPDAADEAEAKGQKTVLKLVGGVPDVLRRYARHGDLVELAPGDIGPNDAAAALADRFQFDQEAAQAVLPAGPVTLPQGLTGAGQG
ncbi:MAG: ribosome rescue protein RqcH [Thermoplasmatota archaeon]